METTDSFIVGLEVIEIEIEEEKERIRFQKEWEEWVCKPMAEEIQAEIDKEIIAKLIEVAKQERVTKFHKNKRKKHKKVLT